MSLASYADLQTSIAGWLKRTNLNDRIPDFISLAEAQLNRQLRVRQMVRMYTRTTDERTIVLPDDYLEAEKFEVDGRTLGYRDRWSVSSADLFNSRSNRAEYTIIGNAAWLLCHVSAASVLNVWYYQRITPLSDLDPQNWLLEDAPDAYLYGSLLQAEPYLKNDARVQIWSQMYQAVIESMGNANNRARTQGAGLTQRAG